MSIGHLKSLALALAAMLAPAVQAEATWVLDGTKIYPAPDIPAIDGGNVVIAGAKIKSVAGTCARVPGANARAPQCNGGAIVAGFQNSHVHFTSDEFLDAGQQPAEALSNALTQMLTRYGYTTWTRIRQPLQVTLRGFVVPFAAAKSSIHAAEPADRMSG